MPPCLPACPVSPACRPEAFAFLCDELCRGLQRKAIGRWVALALAVLCCAAVGRGATVRASCTACHTALYQPFHSSHILVVFVSMWCRRLVSDLHTMLASHLEDTFFCFLDDGARQLAASDATTQVSARRLACLPACLMLKRPCSAG